MSKKIRVLQTPSDLYGVGSFRSIWPAQSLQKHFGDEFEVEINAFPNYDNIDYFKQFDIIHFHRQFGPYEREEKFFSDLKKAGVVLVMDIDDYWEPPTTHPIYELIKREKITEKIIGTLKKVNWVTTTTTIFADYIRKYNPNVMVIPNAIDMTHQMWTGELQKNPLDLCRIATIGGSSHASDYELVKPSFQMLWNDESLKNKFQIVMCGFDTRGTITEIKEDGSRTVRPIQPHETIWNKFEQVFTANYEGLKDDPDYVNWLQKIKKEDYPDQYNKSYVRRWTLPLTQYGKHYDFFDVSMAPLSEFDITKTEKGQVIKKEHVFNKVKSELKIIEAGMKKKALIAQDFSVYKMLLENNKTGILVNDNQKGWYKAMKKVILDKDFRNELAENLHNFVKDKYELAIVTANRAEFYRSLVQNKQAPIVADAIVEPENTLSTNS